MIKVLVADDHDLVRMGITRLLEDANDVQVIGEADTGENAIQLSRELNPDVVLMDIKMPGIGGLEATRKLQHMCPTLKVIVVTAMNDDPYARRVLKAGAQGYITKGSTADEMLKAIRTVMAGQRYISPEIAQKLALKQYSNDAESPFETLSEREMQITMMIVNCQKVQDISDKLCLSPKTVNSYRYRLFDKLEISSDVELTLLAMRHGIIDPEGASKD